MNHPPVIDTDQPTDSTSPIVEAIRPASKRRRIGWKVSLAFGSLIVLGLATTIVYYFWSKRKPIIAESTLDYHAGIINKFTYQMDDLLKEMDKELNTSFSSQVDPEDRLNLDRERLDRAANTTSMVRYYNKFNALGKEMDEELKELKGKTQRYQANPRLTGLLNDLQKARDKLAGVVRALSSKITASLKR